MLFYCLAHLTTQSFIPTLTTYLPTAHSICAAHAASPWLAFYHRDYIYLIYLYFTYIISSSYMLFHRQTCHQPRQPHFRYPPDIQAKPCILSWLIQTSHESSWLLSVTGSLICFRSLKSLISSLNIDTGFLGFFSGPIMTLTNMNINFFCATTESDNPRIWKVVFGPSKCVMYTDVF